jgi:spiro-SPASM protein
MSSNSRVCILLIYYPLKDASLIKDSLDKSFQYVTALAQSFKIPIVSVEEKDPLKADVSSMMQRCVKACESYENILFFHANAWFLDRELTQNILSNHLDSLSDYTFYEYYPCGFAPFALNYGTLKKLSLWMSIDKTPYHYTTIETFLKKDLNQYDTEILVAPKDYRFIKEAFFLETPRNTAILNAIKPHLSAIKELEVFLKEHSKLLVGAPQFIDIALSAKNQQKPIFTPDLKESSSSFLSLEILKTLLETLQNDHTPATIQFSLAMGEPLLHPEINLVFEIIKKYPSFQFLLETNGIALKPYIPQMKELKNLSVVVYLCASTQELYKEIHGSADFFTVEENLDKLINTNKDNTYIQYVRMKENEEDLPSFLERWNFFEQHIIIAQYNDFCGMIPERKVVNLAPLKRFACFKLQRELTINVEGNIVLCTQDLKQAVKVPFTQKKDLQKALTLIAQEYQNHLNENYCSLCQKCDIWYHFNA